MIDPRPAFASITMFALLAACGSNTNNPAPPPAPIATKPDVIITFDGERHACVVALSSEALGSAIPCGDVVSFVKDELRLSSGSIFDIRTVPDVNKGELDSVLKALEGAGYRFIGGPHAALIDTKDH